MHVKCQGLNPSVWLPSPPTHIHPDVLRVVVVVFVLFFLCFGCSQSLHSYTDRRDPPVRLGTMGDEGRGFAMSGQLHPPFFRLLSKTIIDELPKGSSFFYLLFFPPLLFVFCVMF